MQLLKYVAYCNNENIQAVPQALEVTQTMKADL